MNLFAKRIPRGVIYHKVSESISYVLRSLFSPLEESGIVNTFENIFASYCGRKYCTAFPFARTAIYFVLKNLNLPKGSEVLLPPITIKGIVDAVLALDLVPRYVELDLETISFDLDDLENKVNSRVRVAVITPLFGLVPDMPAMIAILRKHNIFIIEDFSQCLNGAHSDKRVGTFGDVGIYSASSIKTLDTLGGGLAITDNEEIDKKLKCAQSELLPPSRKILIKKAWINLVRNVATTNPIFSALTFPALQILRKISPTSALKQTGHRSKARLTALPPIWFQRYTSQQAEIGLARIKIVGVLDERRIANADIIKRISGKSAFPFTTATSRNVYWQLIMHTHDAAYTQKHFAKRGIDIATSSLELVSALPTYPNCESLKNAEEIHRHGIFIPCYPNLRQQEMDRIIRALSDLQTSISL